MFDRIDELAEDVHLLGEFGILPEVVLVVVFDDEGDAALGRVGETGVDGFGGEFHAFIDAQLGTPLAAEDAAVGAAEGVGHVDPAFLLGDFLLAEGGVGMGEVGRAAHHRDDAPGVLDFLAKAGPVRFIGHLEEAGIPFESLDLEGGGEADPFGDGHGAILAEGMHEGFGEGGEAGHGKTEGGWKVEL
jgi:hypothetical protein